MQYSAPVLVDWRYPIATAKLSNSNSASVPTHPVPNFVWIAEKSVDGICFIRYIVKRFIGHYLSSDAVTPVEGEVGQKST